MLRTPTRARSAILWWEAVNIKNFIKGLPRRNITFVFLATLLGFSVGFIILAVAGYNPFGAYGALFQGIFSKPKYMAEVVIKGTPIILTGISFVVAHRSGWFNIGGEGQYIAGTIVATIVGSKLSLPPVLHFFVVVLAAVLAAALIGAFVALLKIKFHVNEVIPCIMLNWIMLYLNNYLVSTPWLKKPGTEASYEVLQSSWSVIAGAWKTSEAGRQQLASSKSPFSEMLLKTDLNYGILIAVVIAILIFFLYQKTLRGYNLRAVGANPSAARLFGIRVERNRIAAFALSAAIAGLAGALTITGTQPHRLTKLVASEGYGFAGIAVALIGASPIGCIFSGLFYAMLTYGSASIQSSTGVPSEIIDIVSGSIIYFIAISTWFRKTILRTGRIKRKVVGNE